MRMMRRIPSPSRSTLLPRRTPLPCSGSTSTAIFPRKIAVEVLPEHGSGVRRGSSVEREGEGMRLIILIHEGAESTIGQALLGRPGVREDAAVVRIFPCEDCRSEEHTSELQSPYVISYAV